ncbi:hypothetical protein HAX54_029125 [Datura stramonium]|uniref:Uncharacterized protein n=1 Tax=Datura stramonium TaxID=4076 RepID=A0ABS8SA64_DATST|nr:hypothetical protein [Datura stramonium]
MIATFGSSVSTRVGDKREEIESNMEDMQSVLANGVNNNRGEENILEKIEGQASKIPDTHDQHVAEEDQNIKDMTDKREKHTPSGELSLIDFPTLTPPQQRWIWCLRMWSNGKLSAARGTQIHDELSVLECKGSK